MSLRIVVFGGKEFIIDKALIRIGRRDSKNSELIPDICLDYDRSAGRNHALVSVDDGKYQIEDTGSKNGTAVNGVDIRGKGRYPLKPGDMVNTGSTLWTAIPYDWIYIKHENLLIFGACRQVISYGLQHCGFKLLNELYAVNTGKSSSRKCSLDIFVEGYSEHITVDIPELSAEARFLAKVSPFKFDRQLLKRMTQPDITRLVINLDKTGRSFEKDIHILGFWQMLIDREDIMTAAAYVLPANNTVHGIIDGAQPELKTICRHASFHELIKSEDKEAESKVLKVLYGYLSRRCHIDYEYPKAQMLNDGMHNYQTIKPPHMVIPAVDPVKFTSATCIDITLLFAACLECLGLNPLLIFLSAKGGSWMHSFLGCWVGASPGVRPLIFDKNLLLEELDDGNLLLLETTGLARGAVEGNEMLSFEQAEALAVKYLTGKDEIAAVDVCALRPPNGRITPLECFLEPEAVKAFEIAEWLADVKRRASIETVFLLYGLLGAGGNATRFLFSQLGYSCEEKKELLYTMIADGGGDCKPLPTLGYIECRRLAEEYAMENEVPCIREQDIWWSLLSKCSRGTKLKEIFDALYIDTMELQKALSLYYPVSRTAMDSIRYSGNLWSRRF